MLRREPQPILLPGVHDVYQARARTSETSYRTLVAAEPVSSSFVTSYFATSYCGACGAVVEREYDYCGCCGQRLVWQSW